MHAGYSVAHEERKGTMTTTRAALRLMVMLLLMLAGTVVPASANGRWTEQQANDWYARQGFLVGANYLPANAINELEMWQADTFDPKRIDLELGWAAALGMTASSAMVVLNAMRLRRSDRPASAAGTTGAAGDATHQQAGEIRPALSTAAG